MASLYDLVYSFAMKYIVILVIVILFARIDYFLKIFEDTKNKVNSSPVEVEFSESLSQKELTSVSEDKTLKKTSKDLFLALLEDFHTTPSSDNREKAIEILKNNPNLFSDKIDLDLEGHVFRWRDLINNNNPELVKFLVDLMNILRGENLEVIRRFFSIWMDVDMENFIKAYSNSKDINCTIAPLFGESIPENERINEYYDRQNALQNFISRSNINEAHKSLAEKCILQLSMAIDKLSPVENNQELKNSPQESGVETP